MAWPKNAWANPRNKNKHKKRKKKNMPGINLNEFATGADQIKPVDGFDRAADGTYEYEITKIGIHKGEKGQSIFIDYRLDNGGSHRDWFQLPKVYGQETDKERQALGRYLKRLIDLGVPVEQANTYDTDSMVGWRGVFDLLTTKGKDGKEYQNSRNFRAGGSVSAAQPAAAPAAAPAQAAAPAAAAGPAVAEANPFGA